MPLSFAIEEKDDIDAQNNKWNIGKLFNFKKNKTPKEKTQKELEKQAKKRTKTERKRTKKAFKISKKQTR